MRQTFQDIQKCHYDSGIF